MHNAIFCCESHVGPIKNMNLIQHYLSRVRYNTTVGPEYDDCLTMPPIRAHNDCDLELLSDDGTNQSR